jgi:hypothetical protein
MKNIVPLTVLVFCAAALSFGLPAVAAGRVSAGVSIGSGGVDSFYVAVGDHYRVAPTLVAGYRERYRLADDELPVVFFLAARAQVGPQAVIDFRIGHRSWFDVAVHFGLSPDIFFVPVGMEKIGPPYGNAYGYYRNRGRGGDWRGFKASDREIVDLVNLRFLSEYHHMTPDEIVARRGRGESFVKIHENLGRGQASASSGKKPKDGPQGKDKNKNKKK